VFCSIFINADLPLRHEMQKDKDIGDLLGVLGWKGEKEEQGKK